MKQGHKQTQIIILRRKAISLAVASVIPAILMASTANATGSCSSANGIVNCSGNFPGGQNGGAILVAPSNYTAIAADDSLDASDSTIVGYSNKSDFTISSIGAMGVSVPKFTTLNIGSGTTSPTYGVAPDSSTVVVTGLKAVPGFFDPFNRINTSLSTIPAVGDTPAAQAASNANANPLVNYEGVDIQQAGTVNNFGIITNTSVGNNVTPLAGNTFLVTNGPKVYTEGGSDNLPYRTIGVWVNGDDTKLNNYGIITVGINNAAITASYPGVSAPMYTSSGGTAFSETFYNGTDTVTCSSSQTTGVCAGHTGTTYTPELGTIKTLVQGTNKPVVYGVLATSDGDDFQENVRINNYNKIGAYNFTTGSFATVVGVEVKENIIDTHIYNAPGAVIEGVSSLLTASGVRTTSGTNGTASTYVTASGGVQAIGTDNNAYQLYVDNFGTITSYGVDGNGAFNGKYGTAIGSSTGEMYLTNYAGANIYGDITVGRSENKFVFTNAGTLTGSIIITPDNSSLTPVLQSGAYVDVSTPVTTVNQIVIQPVIKQAGGGTTANAIGQITGGVYVANATGTHPFSLEIQPLVASGVTLKTGDTYQYSTYNIAIGANAKETTYTSGIANQATSISGANIQLLSSALVHWDFVTGTTNNIQATVANASSIPGITLNGQSVINALMTSSNATASLIQNLSDAGDVLKASEQLRPEINNASTNATLRTTSQVESIVDARISETHLAQASGLRGMATGDTALDKGVWLQGFGFTGQQDRTNNVDGYNANGGGIAVGADTLLSDALRVGAAFSYANTTLDAQGSNVGNNNHINSYQGMLYGSWLADDWYLSAIAGIGQHQFNSRRLVNIGGVIDNPKANYDAWQYFGKVEFGIPMAVNSQFTVVPVASLALSYLDQDAYTETSTNGAALSVQSNDSTSFRSGLGGKALYNFTAGEVKTVLEGRALWLHEFADTKQDTTASFASGGSTFIAQGVDLSRESFNLGASLKFVNVDATQSLSLSYDAEIRDAYVGHTGKVQARFDF